MRHGISHPVQIASSVFKRFFPAFAFSGALALGVLLPWGAFAKTGTAPGMLAQSFAIQKQAGDAKKAMPPSSAKVPDPVMLEGLLQKTQAYPIDLKTVAQLADQQNLTIGADRANVKINHAILRQTQASILPNIAASYTQSRFQGGTQAFGNTVPVYRTTIQPLAEINWTIYPGGQTIYQILAAKRREEASRSGLKLTVQQQVSQAVQSYYALLGAYSQEKVARQSLDSAQKQVDLNQALYGAGLAARLEVTRAKSLLAQQKQVLIQAENTINTTEQQLLEALNLPRNLHLQPDLREAVQKPLLLNADSLDTLLAYARHNNPALIQGQQNIKALGTDFKTARAAIFPSVTLRAYIAGTGSTFDSLQLTRFGGLTANLNLLNNLGMQIPYQMKQVRAQIEQASYTQQALDRNIETRITTAYLSSVNGLSLIDAAREGKLAAEESYQLALGRYKAGVGTDLDVITAQVSQSTAESNWVQAQVSYNTAQVQLLEALGLISTQAVTQGLTTLPPPALAQRTTAKTPVTKKP